MWDIYTSVTILKVEIGTTRQRCVSVYIVIDPKIYTFHKIPEREKGYRNS